MKYKTVIFDFDGTIADTLIFHFAKVQEIVDRYHVANLNHRQIKDEIRSKTPQELMRKFKLSWVKLPFIYPAIKKAQKELNKQIDKIQVCQGMRQMLLNLKKNKYQLGILSSNLKENIDKFLSLKQLEVFDFIHYEKNIFGKDKALTNLMKKYSLIKNDIIYVGDEVRDIEACKKVGIKIIAVTWGIHTKKILLKYKPEYLVDSPKEMEKILQY